jgi:CheY-like chemotaxis protein
MNLVTNARDAMQNGGSLQISSERVMCDETFTAGHDNSGSGLYALLSVSDTGMGMEEETRQQIFEPFFTTKEVGKGTGLGLSVVYGIIKQHDGFIVVSSEPGKGTTFRIYLPLSVVPAVQAARETTCEYPIRGTETILLAEDNESVRNMVLALLQNFGYGVIVAVDGEDAVQKYRENRGRIRLFLFDVVMPKKNGLEAYEEIRETTADIPVIFTSGYAADSVNKQMLSDDTILFLSKPYGPTKLLSTVRTALDRCRS